MSDWRSSTKEEWAVVSREEIHNQIARTKAFPEVCWWRERREECPVKRREVEKRFILPVTEFGHFIAQRTIVGSHQCLEHALFGAERIIDDILDPMLQQNQYPTALIFVIDVGTMEEFSKERNLHQIDERLCEEECADGSIDLRFCTVRLPSEGRQKIIVLDRDEWRDLNQFGKEKRDDRCQFEQGQHGQNLFFAIEPLSIGGDIGEFSYWWNVVRILPNRCKQPYVTIHTVYSKPSNNKPNNVSQRIVSSISSHILQSRCCDLVCLYPRGWSPAPNEWQKSEIRYAGSSICSPCSYTFGSIR